MRIHDVTLTLSSTLPVWPGDPQILIERVRKIEEGANSNVSRLQLNVHAGTHIDAPIHFINDSLIGVDKIPVSKLVGHCFVVEIPEEIEQITAEVLKNSYIPQSSSKVLFKTKNSRFWSNHDTEFHPEFVGISEDGAKYLVDLGVELVGIDYLSIAPYKQSKPTHEEFLNAGVIIIEGLDLSQVYGGYYSMFCLPLKLAGADGAPARVILIEET
jgi:arylformamidase